MVLKKLREFLLGSPSDEPSDPNGIFFYVKCAHCGAPVRVRIDRHNDLTRDFERGGFFVRKEVMDGSCFRLIYATLHFDEAYRVTNQEIEGGEFITWEEYRQLAGKEKKGE